MVIDDDVIVTRPRALWRCCVRKSPQDKLVVPSVVPSLSGNELQRVNKGVKHSMEQETSEKNRVKYNEYTHVQVCHEMFMSLGDNPMSYRTPWYSNSNPILSLMGLHHHMGRYNPNVPPVLCPMGVLVTSMGLYHQSGTLQSQCPFPSHVPWES